MRVLLLILLVASLASCSRDTATYADLNTRDVTLPGGQVIQAETVTATLQMAKGLMFRTSLAPDHGMLFVHPRPGYYSYFMFQHEIPLDIVWLDGGHIVVEIVQNAPPCTTDASQCPHYGGTKVAHYVLEMAGGMARKYDLHVGQRIEF
jgi:uncharacterized membrane protein (UPF0127 family)